MLRVVVRRYELEKRPLSNTGNPKHQSGNVSLVEDLAV